MSAKNIIGNRLGRESAYREAADSEVYQSLSYAGNGAARTSHGGLVRVDSVTNSGLGVGEMLLGSAVSGQVNIDSKPRRKLPFTAPLKPASPPSPMKVFANSGGVIALTSAGVIPITTPPGSLSLRSSGADPNAWYAGGYTQSTGYQSIGGNGDSFTYPSSQIAADLGIIFNGSNFEAPSPPDGESISLRWSTLSTAQFFTAGAHLTKSWTSDSSKATSFFRGSQVDTDTTPKLYGNQTALYSLPGVIFQDKWDSQGLRGAYSVPAAANYAIAVPGFFVSPSGIIPTSIPLAQIFDITVINPNEIYVASNVQVDTNRRVSVDITQYTATGNVVRVFQQSLPGLPEGASILSVSYHPY